MSERMILVGAEDVVRASHNMASAGQSMLSAAAQMEDSLYRHRQHTELYFQLWQELLEKHFPVKQ